MTPIKYNQYIEKLAPVPYRKCTENGRQHKLTCKAFEWTFVFLNGDMDQHVSLELVFSIESCVALFTLEGLGTRVDQGMHLQIIFRLKSLEAHLALKLTWNHVRFTRMISFFSVHEKNHHVFFKINLFVQTLLLVSCLLQCNFLVQIYQRNFDIFVIHCEDDMYKHNT